MNKVIKLGDCQLYNDDCLERMKSIPDKSVDMILCDLPYGSTKNPWDSVLWLEYERIIKDRGAILLFAQAPFDKMLGASNIKLLKYEWIWEKEQGSGHLNSKFCPLKNHENILVFSKSVACFVRNRDNAMIYQPQMTNGKPYRIKKGSLSSNYDSKNDKIVITENNGLRYPKTILKFTRDKNTFHPTQKPVALLEYLIKTYTFKNELVLDNTMGSGSTGVACINTNRKFIGIEKDEKYFEIAKKRINEALENQVNKDLKKAA